MREASFQCRERLDWDFYAYTAADLSEEEADFQCRERLDWDFYPTCGLSV